VWEIAFFGLKLGLDLEMQAAHPTKNFKISLLELTVFFLVHVISTFEIAYNTHFGGS